MYKEIKNHEDLIVGEYYYLFSNSEIIKPVEISVLRKDYRDDKYFNDRIWADSVNAQAFTKWRIFGPIQTPKNIMAMFSDEDFLTLEKAK